MRASILGGPKDGEIVDIAPVPFILVADFLPCESVNDYEEYIGPGYHTTEYPLRQFITSTGAAIYFYVYPNYRWGL